MIEHYRWTINWCDAEEERIKREDPDYWRNPLKGGRMMAVWKIAAEARDNLNRFQMIAGLPWSAKAREAI